MILVARAAEAEGAEAGLVVLGEGQCHWLSSFVGRCWLRCVGHQHLQQLLRAWCHLPTWQHPMH